MSTQPTSRINPWFAFKKSGARSYILATVAVLLVSVFLAMYFQMWSWVSRSGGVIVLFGVLLSLRRLFRLGHQRLEEPTEPPVINKNQFNMNYVYQSIERHIDNFAQVVGVVLMVLGTILSSYGDVILEKILPF